MPNAKKALALPLSLCLSLALIACLPEDAALDLSQALCPELEGLVLGTSQVCTRDCSLDSSLCPNAELAKSCAPWASYFRQNPSTSYCPNAFPHCFRAHCYAACPEGQTRCHGSCIDPMSNSKFCGAKGNCTAENQDDPNYQGQICPETQSCQDGSCQCPRGQAFCGEEGNKTCIDPMSNPKFCGAKGACNVPNNEKDPNYKGKVCDSTAPLCNQGQCSDLCADVLTNCDGHCVDLTSDPQNCGSCGHQCQKGKNVNEATCKNARCGIEQCNSGFADCDGNLHTGCEAKLAEPVEKNGEGFMAGDIKHCGVCDNHCKQSEMHATELSCEQTTHSCSYQHHGTNSGSCLWKDRNSRYHNLDGDDSNGCESLISIKDNSLFFSETGCLDCGIGNKICIKYRASDYAYHFCLPINLNAESQCSDNKNRVDILVTKEETETPSYTLSVCSRGCNADQTACQ